MPAGRATPTAAFGKAVRSGRPSNYTDRRRRCATPGTPVVPEPDSYDQRQWLGTRRIGRSRRASPNDQRHGPLGLISTPNADRRSGLDYPKGVRRVSIAIRPRPLRGAAQDRGHRAHRRRPPWSPSRRPRSASRRCPCQVVPAEPTACRRPGRRAMTASRERVRRAGIRGRPARTRIWWGEPDQHLVEHDVVEDRDAGASRRVRSAKPAGMAAEVRSMSSSARPRPAERAGARPSTVEPARPARRLRRPSCTGRARRRSVST